MSFHDSSTSKVLDVIKYKFDKKYIFFTGRATTAIYLALKALKCKNGSVIMPDLLCPSPANAVLYSGMTPKFCDVSCKDYNIDIDSLNENLTSDTKAIIAVHLFGYPANMNAIREVAQDNNLFVIEDAAQSLGGEYQKKLLGTFGDISVLSFGEKIINAGGGGAVLTDDPIIAKRIKSLLPDLPLRPQNSINRYKDYKKYYYSTAECSDLNKRAYLFAQMPYLFEDLYLYSFEDKIADKLLMELNDLKENIKRRINNVKKFRQKLCHPLIQHPTYDDITAIYRYSILLKGNNQKRVTEAIRNNGYDASNLYYVPLHQIFPQKNLNQNFFNTVYINEHILNLWVDPKISDEYIENVSKIINENLI